MSKKIFLSHAAVDKNLVLAFLRFLKDGLGIDENDVFCTSLSGTLPTGLEFIPYIKKNLEDCEKVVFFITESYFKSPFCLAELGAAWALNQNIYPIVVPPLSATEINRTPWLGTQARPLCNQHDLAVMFEELKRDGIVNPSQPITGFTSAANEFVPMLKKCARVLKTDSEGYAIATVVERNRVWHCGAEYVIYRMKEQLDLGCNYNENDVHWLAHKWTYGWMLELNEKLKFKPADAKPANYIANCDENEKIFIVLDLWAADTKFF